MQNYQAAERRACAINRTVLTDLDASTQTRLLQLPTIEPTEAMVRAAQSAWDAGWVPSLTGTRVALKRALKAAFEDVQLQVEPQIKETVVGWLKELAHSARTADAKTGNFAAHQEADLIDGLVAFLAGPQTVDTPRGAA